MPQAKTMERPTTKSELEQEPALVLEYDAVRKQTHRIFSRGSTDEIPGKPTDWLAGQCLRYGSSMAGRIASYRVLTGRRQKCAVLVSETDRLLYFPTQGLDSADCVWIQYGRLVQYRGIDAYTTKLFFDDGTVYRCLVSRRVLQRQVKSCRAFLAALDENLRVSRSRSYAMMEDLNRFLKL